MRDFYASRPFCRSHVASSVLDESDVFGVLTEALTTDVDAVLTDQAVLVAADAAAARSGAVFLGMGVPHVVVRHFFPSTPGEVCEAMELVRFDHRVHATLRCVRRSVSHLVSHRASSFRLAKAVQMRTFKREGGLFVSRRTKM